MALLGDLAEEITVGFVGSMTAEYVDSGIPFLRSMNVEPYRINKSDLQYIGPTFHQLLRKSRLKPGDVVIVRTGKPGTAAVIPDWLADANCSDLVIVRPGTKLDARFLAYYVNSAARNHIDAHTVGAVQQHFNVGSAKDLHIFLPDLPEQRAIARILGTLDDKIELNRRMNQTLEGLARALFQSWFVDFDPVTAKAAGRRPVGMSAGTAGLFPDTFEDSAMGSIPAGWGVGHLRDIASINNRAINSNFPHAMIEYIDIASVSVGRLEATTPYHVSQAPSRAQRLVSHGDTLWSCVRPNRKSYLLVHHPTQNTVASTGFAVLSSSCNAASFLHLWVTMDEFVDYLTAHAEGSAYPAVRPDTFANADVFIPSPAILEAFERQVSPLFERIGMNDKQSHTLAALRDTLLPRLLSGELRVKAAERIAEGAGRADNE